MSLKFTKLLIAITKLYDTNPLFDIKKDDSTENDCQISEASLKSNLPYLGEGVVNTTIPYLKKDQYGSELHKRYINVAVLENNYLKATFLTDFGGRLYSLFDKQSNRELLYKNDVIKFCNQSSLNAWFSGGVEWNASLIGHSPFSCSKVFASAIKMDDLEGLRIYEYERIREICYSIDFFLPKDSRFLIVMPTIENKDSVEKYNNWWSNIAITETEKTRVIVPAHMSYVYGYVKNQYTLEYNQYPVIDEVDVSYPLNINCSKSYFYNIPDDEEKWIASVDGNGTGLVHASTMTLPGRKLFVWGNEEGGNNWQTILSDNGGKFAEIQAGLTETQLQNIKMEANQKLRWVEAYGAIQIDSKEAHDTNYDTAINSCKKFLNNAFPNGIDKTLSKFLDKKIDTIKVRSYGSGWGYFKDFVNNQNNLGTVSDYLSFSKKSLSKEQAPFMDLIRYGYMKETNPNKCPISYEMTPYIKTMLEKSLNSKAGVNWTAYYQLGSTYYGLGDYKNAISAWKSSYDLKNNAWAARNIAMYYKNIEKNKELGYSWMKKAYDLSKSLNIIKDFCVVCCDTGHYEDLLIEFDMLSKSVQRIGRILYYKAYALNKLGRNNEASKIINYDFKMHDIKEGEISISDLWYKIYGVLLVKDYVGLSEGEIRSRVDNLMPLKNQDFRIHKRDFD